MRTILAAAALALALALAPSAVLAAGPKLKTGTVHHLKSKKHARDYALFVPSNYSPKVSWPLVISSHGRGGSGKGEMKRWSGLAKSHGFIAVCPDMLTATTEQHRQGTSKLSRAEEDDEVLLSIYEEITAQFRVNRRAVMITGFSGGGNPSYWTGLRHPDLITHICTRGGNFAPQQIPPDEKLLKAGRKKLTIFIFYGQFDHELILGKEGNPGQAQTAYDALKKAGYENVTIEKVAGMKHESRPKKAADWFGGFLKANRKKFLAGDQVDGLIEDAKESIGKKKYGAAIRSLKKAGDIEKKNGLDPRAAAEMEKVNAIAARLVADAKRMQAGGDTAGAMKLIAKVKRDFRGVPARDEALKLEKEWKK
jgi:poly(3-hydroxybutyrate) depolymerase